MRLRTYIPSSLSIVGDLVMIYYESQPRSCRRCGGKDHLANSCKTPRCPNCDESGHQKEQCPDNELCNVCFDDKHRTAFCPFVLYSANVEPQEYMAPWKKDQPKGKREDRRAEQQAIALARQQKEKEQRRKGERRAEEKKREERKRQEEPKREEKQRKERENGCERRRQAEERDRCQRRREREREHHHHHRDTRYRECTRDDSTDE